MGLFGGNVVLEQELKNPNELLESFIYDEVSGLSEEKRKEFCESAEAKALEEAGIISRKTLVRLSKADDLSRRIKMAALQLAKDNDDILFDQLAKNRVKEKQLLDKITNKYAMKASKLAKMGQKDYLKQRLTLGFMRK